MWKTVKYFPEVARSNKNEQILWHQWFEAFQEAILVDWIERLPTIIAMKEQNIYDVLIVDRSLIWHLWFVLDSYLKNKYPNKPEFRTLWEYLYKLLDRPKEMFLYLQQWYLDTYKANIPAHEDLYDLNLFWYESMKEKSSIPEWAHFEPEKLAVYMRKYNKYYSTKTLEYPNSREIEWEGLFEQVKEIL